MSKLIYLTFMLPSVIVCSIVATGCSDPYGDCIEQQKTEYRQSHPKASYGEVVNQQRNFEAQCSRLKR